MSEYPFGNKAQASGSTVVLACGVSSPISPWGAYSMLTEKTLQLKA
jgi:hypothetical protein